MRALFRGRKKKNLSQKSREGDRETQEKGQAIRAAVAFALSRRKSCDGFTQIRRDAQIFHVCLEQRVKSVASREEKRGKERKERCHEQSGMQGKARFTSDHARARSSICSEMIPRCLIAQADIIPRAGKRDDFKQRKPPGEA